MDHQMSTFTHDKFASNCTYKEFTSNLLEFIDANITTGPWIAGNMATKLYTNEQHGHSDWDIWCRNEQQAKQLIDQFSRNQYFTQVAKTDNATTFKYEFHNPIAISANFDIDGGDIVFSSSIQIITKRYAESPKEIIDNFDFTVCQVATDGIAFVFGDNAVHDIHNKILRINEHQDALDGLVGRVIKYIVYGYTPLDSTMKFISDNKNRINWERNIEQY